MKIIETVGAFRKFTEIHDFVCRVLAKELNLLHEKHPVATEKALEKWAVAEFPDGCSEDLFIEWLNGAFEAGFEAFREEVFDVAKGRA